MLPRAHSRSHPATPSLGAWPNKCYISAMTHKQHAMTLAKPWPEGVSFWSHVRHIVASLKYIVKIPVGYQDQNGFHYGIEPEKDDISSLTE